MHNDQLFQCIHPHKSSSTEWIACLPALVEAHAIARTEANGPAFAEALSIGLLEGGKTGEAFAAAAAKILNENGCEDTKPTFAGVCTPPISCGTIMLPSPQHLFVYIRR